MAENQEQLDLAAVARDDLLLDALGRGERAPADDEVALMLSAWRADLAADLPVLRPARAETGASRTGGLTRWMLGAAAVVVALAGALTIAAGDAGPGSPLWPITRMVYGDRADSRIAAEDAQRAIADARTAVGEGRYADATRLLDEAVAVIAEMRDAALAQRLLREIEAVRALIPGTRPGGVTPTAPSGAVPAPSPGGGQRPGTSPPAGGQPGLPVPSLPGLPLPSLPLPLPTEPGPLQPLPPGLPLPTILPTTLPPLLDGHQSTS